MRCAVICIWIFTLLAGAATAAPRAKLIHYGWDNPRISELPQVLPKFKTSVFDGISVGAGGYNEIFKATQYPANIHASDKAVLAKLDRTLLKNSYIYVLSKTDGVFDWSNDQHWRASLENMRLLVNLAKSGGFKGIVFDMEPYGKNPWDYGTQQASGRLKYKDMSALVRRRGADMMRVIQKEYPGIEIWCLYGLTALNYENADVAAGTPIADVLQASGSGLWASFFNGWIDVKAATTTIIEGNEPAYYYTRWIDFTKATSFIRKDLAKFMSPESRSKYSAGVKIGQAVYVDGVMSMHKSPRFIGYYFKNDTERAKLLHSNTLNALRNSESLVWVYAEEARWWNRPLTPVIDTAIRKAKADAARGASVLHPWAELVAAEKGLKEAVTIGGAFTSTNGKGFVPSSWGSPLNNAACSTWGDRGSYSCTFPKGANIVITPKIAGKTIVPASRSYRGLAKTDWSVSWSVR
jgi:hypothetical protein